MLQDFLTGHRAEIIRRTQAKSAVRRAPRASTVDLDQGIPIFLDQLTATLEGLSSQKDAMDLSAVEHGTELLRLGFTVGQVVHAYGDVCQAVTELAFELDADIPVDEFKTLNRCLDDATAHAVTEFGRRRELSLTEAGTERFGVLAHELRNRLNTAMLSFAVLKDGTVSIGGSTGAVLERSLKGAVSLIDYALAEVRLKSHEHEHEPVVLAELIEEIEITAILEAKVRQQVLTINVVDVDIVVDADRMLLAAALGNLLQNAFKFTDDGGEISVRVRSTANQVFIDIEDQCGGLAEGLAAELFRPFHQRNTDRSGLGLGLSISRKAIQRHGGEISVSNLPGKGCIFTVELPRLLVT